MSYKQEYERWLHSDALSPAEHAELESIAHDEKEIENRFYGPLEFGTAGLRGTMKVGLHQMNIHVIRWATQGFANVIAAEGEEAKKKGVAICMDCRNNNMLFSHAAAEVCAANGIHVRIFESLRPTPELSFAVRYYGCQAGINVTASHNPKEYNGYKVYDSKGCQLVPDDAERLIGYVNAVTDLGGIPLMPLDEAEKAGRLTYIGEETLEAFLCEVKKLSLYSEKSDLRIVYTPLHGTGNIPVRRILADKNVSVVAAQELPDGEFSTVRSPNPEEHDALLLAIEQAKAEGADIVIGTDPDCDRVGVGVKTGEGFTLLTGNQTGALLTDFILKFKKDIPANAAIVKTIVTSGIGAAIAAERGVQTVQTLTGFKYIGKKICDWELSGEHTFIFGYEESYGYLAGTHARDKDAVSSSMLIAEMAAYYKAQGMTLIDALNGIYAKYGYYYDCLETLVLKGKAGAEKICAAMSALRAEGGGLFDDIEHVSDYLTGIDDLPRENVLRFEFNDGSWAAVRPSGTEPKLKLYFSVRGEDRRSAEQRQKAIRNALFVVIDKIKV